MIKLSAILVLLAVPAVCVAAENQPPAGGLSDAVKNAPDSTGDGPYLPMKEEIASLPDHVVYHPRDMAAVPPKALGLYIFGNGGCRADGASARQHLLEITSHGYIAIAPGKILSGPGTPNLPPRDPRLPSGKFRIDQPASSLTDALDWALAENARQGSPFYGKIDPAQVAVSGFSCGGLQALNVAGDPRFKTTVIMNSGALPEGRNPIEGMNGSKSLLEKLHGTVLYVLGGETDVAHPNGTDDFSKINHIPAALVEHHYGHGGTYSEPNGGIAAQIVVAWLDWRLKGDQEAAKQFVGEDCGICKNPELTISRKNF